jgi:phage terminase small subunit
VIGGQQPKPEAVLKLHGDYRADRHANRGPKLGGEALRKPDDLPEHASWLWDEVTTKRAAWLCGSDAATLRTLCEAFHLMRVTFGYLLTDPGEKNMRCAWVAYAGLFNSIGARFGLTPSDRARLGEDKPLRDEEDELKDMLS